jgi:predicted alpha/beta hydrolase family esterase
MINNNPFNVILLHSRGGAKKIAFYKEIQNFCDINEIQFCFVEVAEKEAKKTQWFEELDRLKDQISTNTIFIGHSMGCIAICKYLSDNNIKCSALHLVAGWYFNSNSDNENSTLQGLSFEPESIDFQMLNKNIKYIDIYYSSDDKDYRIANSLKYIELMKGVPKIHKLSGYGHFDTDNLKVPELLEVLISQIKTCTKM